jgi:microcystin-dependent protein
MNNWSGTAVGGTATSTGSGAAHNNVQPTIVANYIIYAGV